MKAAAGFTLIELLAATALAALLMTAVLAVTAGFGRDHRAMRHLQPPRRWQDRLAALMDADLRHARHVRVNEDNQDDAVTLELETLVHLAADTLERRYRPVRVTYHFDPDTGVLRRRQTDLLKTAMTTTRATRVDVVAVGIDTWEIALLHQAPEDEAQNGQESNTRDSETARTQDEPVTAVQLTARFTGSDGEPGDPWTRRFVLPGESQR